jgi:hypothetical protein
MDLRLDPELRGVANNRWLAVYNMTKCHSTILQGGLTVSKRLSAVTSGQNVI